MGGSDMSSISPRQSYISSASSFQSVDMGSSYRQYSPYQYGALGDSMSGFPSIDPKTTVYPPSVMPRLTPMSLVSANTRPERTDYHALPSLRDNSAKTDQQDIASKETTVAVEVKPTKTKEPLLASLKTTFDRLTNIQTYTQVLTKSYQLHEYPIPRLFVVLPELIMDVGDLVSGPVGRRPSVLTSGTRTSQSG
ncbi:hypothetical protein BG000_005048, partial [Podila horticola]